MINTYKEAIMSDTITNIYKITSLKNRIEEVYSLVDYCKILDSTLELPKITANYKVMYSQRLQISSSKVEEFVIEKIMKELNRNKSSRAKLLSEIAIALKKLSEIEIKVFKLAIYERLSEEDIADELNYCLVIVRKIKKSAYARFLISLGVDYDCFN